MSAAPSPEDDHKKPQEKRTNDGTPASVKSSLASPEQKKSAEEQDEESNEKRNHPRSKRKKNAKDPVGISPPTPQPKQDDRHPFPLSNLGSGGSLWEKERERGE